ncbi:MAG: sulfatase-like hydrolase/transferase [Oscillospiraceae bacterium]
MKKQVVFIMVDTQRTDMLGCYGNEGMKTPCLDALSKESLTYDLAYTCQPVCGPARSTIFTGLYPHSNGMWTNSIALGDNVKTIGQRLRDNKIHSGYIGKWHLDGGDYFGLGKCPDGWDSKYWYDMKCYLDELTPDERVKSRNEATSKEDPITEDFTYAHRCSNRAISFIDEYKDEDFFMTVSYDEPHDPGLCPEPFASMYDDYVFPKSENIWDDLENKPSHQKVWAGENVNEDKDSLDITKRRLLACNSYVDYEIGRVLDEVHAKVPDALIIYTSDHGDMMSAHSLFAKGPAPYDEITKIPLMIKSGNPKTTGKRYPYPVSHINLVPTILEYMGVKRPQWLEGVSILDTVSDASVRVNDCIFMEFGRYEIDHDGFGGFQPLRCVFDGKYKLCINLLSEDEMYDMENDKAEMVNLINNEELIPVRNKLHDKLLNWMNETRDPFRGYYWERRPWRTDAREATWAYTGSTRQRENEEYEPRQLDYSTGLEMKSATREKKRISK